MDTKKSVNANKSRRRSTPKRGPTVRRHDKALAYRGKVLVLPPTPPTITTMPWNSAVVSYVHTMTTAVYTLQLSTIVSALKKQLDPTNKMFASGVAMQFRFKIIKAWNLTSRSLVMSVLDFTDSRKTAAKGSRVEDDLGTWSDIADARDTFARVGFEYPTSMQDMTLATNSPDNDDNSIGIVTVGGNVSDEIVFYITLQWKGVLGLNPAISNPYFKHLRNTANNTSMIAASARTMNASLNTIAKAQPGLVTKVIEGVATGAAVVAPIMGEMDNDKLVSALRDLTKRLDKIKVLEPMVSDFTIIESGSEEDDDYHGDLPATMINHPDAK